eukprot:TRINITY_DN5517_c0_g1_i1.p1 TRINITY_DN5517_c0_g1~~TRINITY_DN5517_c0_g1_i1.p1  ORF type:complete len:184 (-),score=10.89 TRINITY_DN5517_c0_g1_i1:169-720(-)
MVTPLKSSLDELQKKATSRIQTQNTKLFDENNVNPQPSNEIVDTKNMSTRTMLEMQNKMMQDHEGQLDNMIRVVQNIKKVGETIGTEVDLHNSLLRDFDDGVSRNIKKMEKTQGKLQDYMKKASNCCLYLIILGELLLMVMLISLQRLTQWHIFYHIQSMECPMFLLTSMVESDAIRCMSNNQ